MVGDGADGEALVLTPACARVPGDGDERGVATILRGLDHRDDIVVPVEHVSRLGHGLAVSGRRSRDVLEDLGDIVAVGDVPTEHPESDPVVPIRVGVFAPVVDPGEELVADLLILERVDEPDVGEDRLVSLLGEAGHDRAVAQELLVALVAVFGVEQPETVTEIERPLAFFLVEDVGSLDLFAELIDGFARVARHRTEYSHNFVRCKPWVMLPSSTFLRRKARSEATSQRRETRKGDLKSANPSPQSPAPTRRARTFDSGSNLPSPPLKTRHVAAW